VTMQLQITDWQTRHPACKYMEEQKSRMATQMQWHLLI